MRKRPMLEYYSSLQVHKNILMNKPLKHFLFYVLLLMCNLWFRKHVIWKFDLLYCSQISNGVIEYLSVNICQPKIMRSIIIFLSVVNGTLKMWSRPWTVERNAIALIWRECTIAIEDIAAESSRLEFVKLCRPVLLNDTFEE